jgi:hypothetical protein
MMVLSVERDEYASALLHKKRELYSTRRERRGESEPHIIVPLFQFHSEGRGEETGSPPLGQSKKSLYYHWEASPGRESVCAKEPGHT